MSKVRFTVGDRVTTSRGNGVIEEINLEGARVRRDNGLASWVPAAALTPIEQEAPEQPQETEHDPVKNPAHYRVGGIRCRDVIEALGLGFYLGNAFKYLWRAGRKGDAIEDLRKAARNIEYEIERLEKEKITNGQS